MSSPQPIQAPPVQRPSLVQPIETLPVANASQSETLYFMFLLMHGCNFNDPPQLSGDFYRKRGSV